MASSQRSAKQTGQQHVDVVTLTMNGCSIGALAAVLGVAMTLIVALSTWALAPHGADSSPEAAVRLAAGLWLLAHHVPIDLPTGSLGLTPLGLMLLPGLVLYAGGRQLARAVRPSTVGAVARTVVPFSLTYGVCAAIVAGVSGSESVRPHPWAAFISAAIFAVLAGGWGLVRGAGIGQQVKQALPATVGQACVGAAAGLATLVAFAATVTALCLAIGFPEAVDMFRALNPDVLGGGVLALLGVAFVPNLVVWALSFSTGVGFTLGVGGTVSPRGVEYGAMPVFPPLTAIPPEGTPGAIALIVLLAPLCAGAVAGWVVHRQLPTGTSEQVVARAGLAGVLCGLAVAALCWLAAGPVASGQLSQMGPVAWQVGLVTALEVGLVAAATAWEAQRRSWHGGGLLYVRDRARALRSR
ncbi:MAG: DUF6350 family protein [Candidatus Nanopelagicales bacterium]